MELCYKKERDRDFFEVCEKLRGKGYIRVVDLVSKAILHPAQSFYISEDRIARIIRASNIGVDLIPTSCHRKVNEVKVQLYKDIMYEVNKLDQSLPINIQAREIEFMPAPRFYFSVSMGATIYYSYLKKLRQQNAIRTRARILDNFFRIQ